MRWSFVVAGLGALVVAAIRTRNGIPADLVPITEALGDNPLRHVVAINWHALSIIMVGTGVALLLGSRAPRDAARAIGAMATFTFAAVGVVFMSITHQATGSPFTYMPWMPLTVITILCAFATWRAGVRAA